MAEPTPGQVITPGGSSPSEPPKDQAPPLQEVSVDMHQSTVAPESQPVSPPQSTKPGTPTESTAIQQAAIVPSQPDTTVSNSQASPSFEQPPSQPHEGLAPQFGLSQPGTSVEVGAQNQNAISWTASEYIAHQKSGAWYAVLGVATLIFAALVYWITDGDIISVIVIVFAALVFGTYAGKKPKEQAYAISPSGITIGSKTYSFSQLKNFSISEDGVFSSITFWPLKRFLPTLSIYYDPKDEEEIVTMLSSYLPMDTQKRDPIDNLMRKIRF